MSVPLQLAWILVLCAGLAGLSQACQICVPLPEHTLADRLLESDAVVLAREDPARPFYYRAIETLAGAPADAPIDLFLHSQARRTLAVYPERAMVLGYSAKDRSWSALGITDPEYERVVRAILAHADRWVARETDNAARLDWFLPLLGHADGRLHELAYLEIGRAPYAEIRRLARDVPAGSLDLILDDPMYLEWRSLAVLMLGESERAEDQARVRETLARKAAQGISLNLAAWATALMAVDGLEGIRRLESLYLSGGGRTPEELDAVVQALSVYGQATPALRDPVVEAYRRILEARPEIAPKLVHDLIAWRRRDLVEPIRRAAGELQGDPLGRYALAFYLRFAEAGHGGPGGASSTLPAISDGVSQTDDEEGQ